ncbi:15834_t:CDS:2 [Funneliformis caledonium]|uniref:15834_t:CDS:1 n=1 Tax=Funneliformis caledonium TaxID=1117310 RepID=A0A9N9EWF5_9GLOM|nr:15834_t:CDS:2 [Funneliformis caledonium]
MRAIHELAKLYHVIYLCFRSSVSTGYPKVTIHSLTLKNEIEFCDTMVKAEAVAKRWLTAMVITFLDKSSIYNRKKHKQNQAKEFWDAVYQKKKQIDISPTLTLNQFIIICFDKTSAFTETDNQKVFRTIRRALCNQWENIIGIFADTNFSIGDLVSAQDEDDSTVCSHYFNRLLKQYKLLRRRNEDGLQYCSLWSAIVAVYVKCGKNTGNNLQQP